MNEKPNRLIHEKSPYLLQHAHNPVDWHPWGEEAFARARAEDKPVFLSVGYSTCHWCHVMEKESFENDHIAGLLNRWFISIKVDREERPDVDQLYMSATQAISGSGGWPMSVFLLPDGKPFHAGTYFPPESMYGRPGFADLLTAIHEAWITKRDDLAGVGQQMVKNMADRNREPGSVIDNILDKAYAALEEEYERDYGGFSRAPKFPRPVQCNFLFRYWASTGRKEARDMALQTLRHMAAGGIHDHLGGGFHRYATDYRWRVPHFEKMLYDQAQLADSYLDAFLITGDPLFAEVARNILTYVRRDMTAPEGGFYSAEDADSEDPYNPGSHSEGAFYLWTADELAELLGDQDGQLFAYRYGISKDGNAPEDPHDEFKGKNILYLAHTVKETAEQFSLPGEVVRQKLQQAARKVYERRSARKKPHLDDKVLVSWNGMTIGAFARGGAILQDPDMIKAAAEAARFIRAKLYRDTDKTLLRRYRDNESGLAGQLDDYTFLVAGLLELYQAEQDPQWLGWALELTETQIRLFHDSEQGGFFDSVADDSLPLRMKGDYDGAEPAPNSVAAMNLLRLALLTGKKEWREMGIRTMEAFSYMLNQYPVALPQMLCAWDQLDKSRQVVIAGDPAGEDTRKLMRTALSVYAPDKVLLLADNSTNQQYLNRLLPFMETMDMIDNKATAYVCRNFTCRLPVNDHRELNRLLEEAIAD